MKHVTEELKQNILKKNDWIAGDVLYLSMYISQSFVYRSC